MEGRSALVSTSLADFQHYLIHPSRTYFTSKHGIVLPISRLIIVYSLKFLVSCLIFRRKLQARFYHCVLGMLSAEDKEKYRRIENLISRLARLFKLEPVLRVRWCLKRKAPWGFWNQSEQQPIICCSRIRQFHSAKIYRKWSVNQGCNNFLPIKLRNLIMTITSRRWLVATRQSIGSYRYLAEWGENSQNRRF